MYLRTSRIHARTSTSLTLHVAHFCRSHSEKSDTEDLAALADRLKTPMSAQSQQLKRYMVETIVPAVQRVKKVHDTLEEEGLYPFLAQMISLLHMFKPSFRGPSGHGLRNRPPRVRRSMQACRNDGSTYRG